MMQNEVLERALLSLDGLTVGDAFGELLSVCARGARKVIERNSLPRGPWWHTDDSQMAMAVVETLSRYQRILPDALAARFTARFRADPGRGYGKGARMQMEQVLGGASWRVASAGAFSGRGSKGNGGAMRVAPLGAYFAEDLQRVHAEATASAEVTHSHPEGIAGTIAVALAAAVIWQNRAAPVEDVRGRIWQVVLAQTPKGETWDGLQKAAAMPFEMEPEMAARILGSGFLVTAPDTVPFALWCAARHLDNYAEALLSTLEGDGDCDTNCAIVGGLVSLYVGRDGIPADWLAAREPLDLVLESQS
jgi:ADP-ribosylglycohydrolase